MFSYRELGETELAYLAQVAESSGGDEARVEYAAQLMRRGLPVLFDEAHLAWTTCTSVYSLRGMAMHPSAHYSRFRIPKRSGGSREIAAPGLALKHVQRWIANTVLSAVPPHPEVHGFVVGRSIATNAGPHIGQPVIVKLDITDFFPTVSEKWVFGIFRRLGYSISVSDLLTRLSILGRSLPQGAPSSPALANIAARKLDSRLSGIARKHGLQYTRYADDLTFSGSALNRSNLMRLIDFVIRDCGFRPNDHKARFIHAGGSQRVTGVVVNERLNWPRERRRKLRQEIYYLRQFGAVEHLRRIGELDRRKYRDHFYGRVLALNAIRPDEAAQHLRALDEVDWGL